MRILDCFTPQTKQYEGRLVSEIATAEGKEPFDALLDIVIADGLLTSFTPARPPDSEADWEARAQVFRDPRAVIGASDAGAHLDLLATFNFSTVLLAEAVRKQRVLELEEAVRLITQVPAELYGLRRRGTLAVGSAADVVVFDEATIDTQTVSTRVDLPAGIGRLYAEADGIGHVIVNGVEIARHGVFTEHRPGTLLRSGRDTYNPSLN
jgi:N-acyl-D-aspartate/D-glutamate deacylase